MRCKCENYDVNKIARKIQGAKLKDKIENFIKVGFRSGGQINILRCQKCLEFWEIKIDSGRLLDVKKKVDRTETLIGVRVIIAIEDPSYSGYKSDDIGGYIEGELEGIVKFNSFSYGIVKINSEFIVKRSKITAVAVKPRFQGYFLSDLLTLESCEKLIVDVYTDINDPTSDKSHRMIGEATVMQNGKKCKEKIPSERP